eukprot:CAMPEP_0198285632 /NCGR_PEP_ID=MMETSP1449-20131203/4874_1 /TAXON_ID=420275 /ORGANISM="Attheya septentrionalis, Strain CCMP2084" /LENGTH=364 /DNA_ID=CAMNT_0043983113 /DNA_START=156 /DNA_END=1247 /DNA_ORIENTATION=-
MTDDDDFPLNMQSTCRPICSVRLQQTIILIVVFVFCVNKNSTELVFSEIKQSYNDLNVTTKPSPTNQSETADCHFTFTGGNETSISQERCTNIVHAKVRANMLWNNQQGYLWMQHSRKAGGTTLCMNLRLNIYGLVQLHAKDHVTASRETCQILAFCSDCDVKKKPGYSVAALPGMVRAAMDSHGRNFIEIEGSGIPDDMLESSWDDFVFVSTIRHPVDRIVSALLNDQCEGNRQCFEQKKRSFASDVSKCQLSVYNCNSNYFVRTFSGLDNRYTTDEDMLEKAKMNFLRFSCVVVVEYWNETVRCLETIGLHLKDIKLFNVAGDLQSINHTLSRETDYGKELSQEELALMKAFNEVDIQFYDW